MESRETCVENELEREIDTDDFFPAEVSVPYVPDVGPEKLEDAVTYYMTDWCKQVENPTDLSYFELDVKKWAHMWRIVHESDIIWVIVDVRYGSLTFPPSLHYYVVEVLNKPLIIVLNKTDLVKCSVVLAWRNYFEERFQALVVMVTNNLPEYRNLDRKKDLEKVVMGVKNAQMLMRMSQIAMTNKKVDWSKWEYKIRNKHVDEDNIKQKYSKQDPKDMLVIGCVGYPSVGKTSLIKSLKGGRLKTMIVAAPQKTKTFSRIWLTDNICLLDSPGVIFPSTTPRKFMAFIDDCYDVDYMAEPYPAIKFLIEQCELKFQLRYFDFEKFTPLKMSTYELCKQYALDKKNKTAKKYNRPLSNQSKNLSILEFAVAILELIEKAKRGQFSIYLKPPNFSQEASKWTRHEDNKFLRWIGVHRKVKRRTNKYKDISSVEKMSIISEYNELELSQSSIDEEAQTNNM